MIPGSGEEKHSFFTFDKVYDVSGLKNTKVHHHDIVIPGRCCSRRLSSDGSRCTDAAGNQTKWLVICLECEGTETERSP